jgi:hypothetical protein
VPENISGHVQQLLHVDTLPCAITEFSRHIAICHWACWSRWRLPNNTTDTNTATCHVAYCLSGMTNICSSSAQWSQLDICKPTVACVCGLVLLAARMPQTLPLPLLLQFAVDSYEPYTITTAHGTRVTLTACNVQDGAPQARHNSTVWELCRLHGGKVALREPASGRYLSARNDGNVRPLTHLQAWEAWELVPVGDCGSRFAFRSVHGGRLLQAHPEKAHLVLGPAHRVGELDESNWEVFHLVPGHGPEACAVCATGREEVAHWVGFRGCAHQVCGGCAVAWVRQQLNSAMPEAYPLRCMVQGDCPGRLIGTQQLCNPRVSADVLGGQEPLSATDATRYRAFVQRAEEQRQQQQQQQQAVDDQAAMRAMGARPCPWCGFMTIHHKGHGCHHIAPGRGCPGCRQHWCFNCGQRSQIRDGWAVPCRCPIFCTPECTCPVCTECSPGQPCDQCEPGQNCPVCAHGAVPECRQA